MDTSEARACIKGTRRQNQFAMEGLHRGRISTAKQWLREARKWLKTQYGEANVCLYETTRSRTGKITRVEYTVVELLPDNTAKVFDVRLYPRKQYANKSRTAYMVSRHALIRLTAEQVPLGEVFDRLMNTLSDDDNSQGAYVKEAAIYTDDGMFALVCGNGAKDPVVVKTFIRADKFKTGGKHDRATNLLNLKQETAI